MATISNKIQKLINDQFHREVFSANLYLAMSSHFLAEDLDGFANFFRVQAEEEMMHAMKQFDYLHQVDGKITIGQIDAPETKFGTLLEIFKKALEHEQFVTHHIHQIVKASLEEADFATHNFFQWFVQEQVEEEAVVRSLIGRIRLAGNNKGALYLLNEELAKRKLDPNEE